MLQRNEFKVLNVLRSKGDVGRQRELADECGLSVGTVNSVLASLRQKGLAFGNAITEAGRAALEPYRVDNAVIMAAGLSSRFAPISYERPKGVLKVRGEVLIERQIRQLQEAGITDITVVVGYMKEEFFYLADQFDVDIVVNPLYAQRNNNYTLWLVRDRLKNTFICSSDDYFTENVFEPYVYEAYYAAAFTPNQTAEYLLTTGGHGLITKVSTCGGDGGWYMLGHVYFSREFSQRFLALLGDIIELPETAGQLWEDIYAEHVGELPLYIRRYPEGVLNEFDTLDELRAFDPAFIDNVNSRIFDNIANVLECSRGDIVEIKPLKKGLTNMSFKFSVGDETYVYRHPGDGAGGRAGAGAGVGAGVDAGSGADGVSLISRRAEAEAERIARDLGLDKTFIHEDPEDGWKVSRFLDGCAELDYHDEAQVRRALQMARSLHECGRSVDVRFDAYEKAEKLVALLAGRARTEFADFAELHDSVTRVHALLREDGVQECLCHNDLYPSNYLVEPGGDMALIDWEYAGMSDYASDLGTFICCSDYTYEEAVRAIGWYFGREPTAAELRHCLGHVALSAFYWFVWAIYKDECGEPVGESLYTWYRFAKDYAARLGT